MLARQRAYVSVAQQLTPMLQCVRRCSAALRSRALLRSVDEEWGDGTLDGIAAEVEGLVAAEAARAADLAGAPPGVAHHVLRKLQTTLEVKSVGDIGPRVDELTRAARLALNLLQQLRDALQIESTASSATCLATASRLAQNERELSWTCSHLCGLLKVGSVDALVPAVRHLCLSHPGLKVLLT